MPIHPSSIDWDALESSNYNAFYIYKQASNTLYASTTVVDTINRLIEIGYNNIEFVSEDLSKLTNDEGAEFLLLTDVQTNYAKLVLGVK